jgi:hypothetical protein
MRKVSCPLKFLFIFFTGVNCIIPEMKAQADTQHISMPMHLGISFFYDFPQSFGASAGVAFPLRSKLLVSPKKNGQEEMKYRDLVVASDIGYYQYPFNNNGLYFYQSIGKRYHRSKPYYFEWLLNAGALRTFYEGLVYKVDESGNVNELKNFGRYYFTSGLATTFGFDFERSIKPKPFAIAVKTVYWIQYPYNSFLLPHLSAQLTFNYHFNNLNIRVKQKKIKG